jgi:hypothetical protein
MVTLVTKAVRRFCSSASRKLRNELYGVVFWESELTIICRLWTPGIPGTGVS